MVDRPSPITSPDNPLAKRIRRLRQRKHRRAEGAFFAEGPRAVLAALQAGAPIEVIIHAPELLTSEVARRALTETAVPIVTVSAPVFGSLSERDHPTGIGAVVGIAEPDLAALAVRPGQIYVVLAGVSDPGNLGTILRTMDAVGTAGLILVGPETTDPYHPTAVKASLGALFTIPITRAAWSDLWAWAAEHGVRTVATSAHAERAFWDPGAICEAGSMPAPGADSAPILLLFGGERTGLGTEVIARADACLRIPMWGTVSSLNLAVAAGLVLYEARRGVLQARS